MVAQQLDSQAAVDANADAGALDADAGLMCGQGRFLSVRVPTLALQDVVSAMDGLWEGVSVAAAAAAVAVAVAAAGGVARLACMSRHPDLALVLWMLHPYQLLLAVGAAFRAQL